MPSWKGVINAAQASAIAAYILAGFPHTGATYDPDPAKPADIYAAYACIDCHGQVGANASPSPAPNPLDGRQGRCRSCATPPTTCTLSEFRTTIMDGSIPAPGTKGVILMPAWGQILTTDQVNAILPYIVDGPRPTSCRRRRGGAAAARRRAGAAVAIGLELAVTFWPASSRRTPLRWHRASRWRRR